MIFLLAFIIGFSDSHVTVLSSVPSHLEYRIDFTAYDRSENIPVTRFIVSESVPHVHYEILTLDSVTECRNINTANPVQIGEPLILEGCTLYPIITFPSYAHGNTTTCTRAVKVTVDCDEPVHPVRISPSMESVFRNLILNNKSMVAGAPQGYLIITADAFYDEVLPLARWKEKKGWHVTVARLSQTGSSSTEIKNFIADRYNSDSIPPEYVLLVGDRDILPPAATATPVSTTDHPYTLITGNDFLSELLIGRLPAANAGEAMTMVAKIIGYEQDPHLTDPSWFERALMVAANYPIGIMTTPIPMKRWVREELLAYGFSTVDTVFYPPTSSATPITNAINQGVLFVNYRGGDADPDGWIHPNFHNDEVAGLSNGWKLPVVTSIVCLNGYYGGSTTPCFGQMWLKAGNPTTPRGAVAFFGAAAATTSSRWNNCLDYGIYWGLLKDSINTLGPALYRGKMEVLTNFPLDTTWYQGSSFYFHTYNLLGDPSLAVWTAMPDSFIVTHAATGPVGTNALSVQVNNNNSQPVADALVSLYKESEVKNVALTDASGRADFTFMTATEDSLFVTVTKANFKPYCGYCAITSAPVYVGYYDHTIDDASGNNNGEINPGETINTSITLKNYGTSGTATNITAKLVTHDPLIDITDSLNAYGSIAAGATGGPHEYTFTVSTNVSNGHVAPCTLEINTDQGTWYSSLPLLCKAPAFAYQRHTVLDGGNGVLEPGETSDFIVSTKNCGALAGTNITGTLRSLSSAVAVTDSLGGFGDVLVGDSAANSSDHFVVQAAASVAPGHAINFVLFLSGDNSFQDTIWFRTYIGVVDQTQPCGPDRYGYFAYDDSDTDYASCPTYQWIEIDPEHGGAGDTLSLADNETKTIPLPFSFTFYGESYDRISISSNGYAAMDSTWIADMYNWHIPAAGGPPRLIAPFWDDLDPTATDSSGSVCYWFDATNNKFIVEFSRVQHIHDPTNPTPAELQTFEIVLLDPQHYPTATGDGEIIFQYMDITNDDIWHNYATVGIENAGHTIGLEYTHANSYPPGAAPLANSRAIKFTTNPPDTFPSMIEEEHQLTTGIYLSVFPNPSSKTAVIRYEMRDESDKELSIRLFDITGRLVKQWSYITIQLSNQIVWDGTDDAGHGVPAGIYFVQLQNGDNLITEKIITLR